MTSTDSAAMMPGGYRDSHITNSVLVKLYRHGHTYGGSLIMGR